MLGTNGDTLGIRQLQQRIEELEEKNKTFEDYNKDLNNQLDKLQEENKQYKEYIKKLKETNKNLIFLKNTYSKSINKALKFIDGMFNEGDEDKIIDNLLKLEEILKGEKDE